MGSRGECSYATTSSRSASTDFEHETAAAAILTNLDTNSKTLALIRASHGWATDACGSHFTDSQTKKCILKLS